MNEIVKGLNGDALQTAMDFSVDELVGLNGSAKFVDAMRLMVFPSKKAEAKELYRAGHKQNGMLSRQKGESMSRRWWKLLKQMDDSVYIGDDVLGDLMLDSASITDDQGRLVLIATAGETGFEEVAQVLMKQHQDSTQQEARAARNQPTKQGWRRDHGYAHVAVEDRNWDQTAEYNEECSSSSAYPAMAYDYGEDEHYYDEVDDEKGAVEIDALTAFLADDDGKEDNDASCQLCADAAQAQTIALFAWNKFSKGKGKGFGKDKGKGKAYFSKG